MWRRSLTHERAPAPNPSSRWDRYVDMILIPQELTDANMDVHSFLRQVSEEWQVTVDEAMKMHEGGE